MRIASTFSTVATILTIALVESRVEASTADEVVTLISKNVLKYLEDQGKKELFVDQFIGPKTSGGRLLEVLIRERLRRDGVTILKDSLNANWTLRGQLRADTRGKNAIVAVKVELLDGDGNSKAEFKKRFREDFEVQAALEDSIPAGVEMKDEGEVIIDAPKDLMMILAPTVDYQSPIEHLLGMSLDSDADHFAVMYPEDQDKKKKMEAAWQAPMIVQKEVLMKPSCFLDSATRVRASEKSGFGIEIRVCPTIDGPFVPVQVEDRSGRAFVNLPPEQYFQVHVFNDEKFDVGMELRIDGISTMYFQQDVPDYARDDRKWLIRAGSQGAAVKGWFISPGKVERFINKQKPDGVAASLGMPHRIGNIQALFSIPRTREQGLSVFDVVMGSEYRCGLRAIQLINPESEKADKVDYFLGACPFPLASISVIHLNQTQAVRLP